MAKSRKSPAGILRYGPLMLAVGLGGLLAASAIGYVWHRNRNEQLARENAQARRLDEWVAAITGVVQRAAEEGDIAPGLNPEDVAVRPVSMLGFLKQFRPAESSESVGASVTYAPGRLDLDSLIESVAARLGLAATGVLSMPFTIELDAGLGRLG